MLQIVIRDAVLDKEIYDSVKDGHFDEKFKTLPLMIQKIFNVWQYDCFSFHNSHGDKLHDSLIFKFGGFEYMFFDVYWD